MAPSNSNIYLFMLCSVTTMRTNLLYVSLNLKQGLNKASGRSKRMTEFSIIPLNNPIYDVMLMYYNTIHKHVCSQPSLSCSYLWHVVDQQQRNSNSGDVMCAADLQDVSQAHDGRIPGCDVPWTHVVVHAQVEDDMDLWQVGVPRDVKLTLRKRRSR